MWVWPCPRRFVQSVGKVVTSTLPAYSVCNAAMPLTHTLVLSILLKTTHGISIREMYVMVLTWSVVASGRYDDDHMSSIAHKIV